jgi:hypothetical protein
MDCYRVVYKAVYWHTISNPSRVIPVEVVSVTDGVSVKSQMAAATASSSVAKVTSVKAVKGLSTDARASAFIVKSNYYLPYVKLISL